MIDFKSLKIGFENIQRRWKQPISIQIDKQKTIHELDTGERYIFGDEEEQNSSGSTSTSTSSKSKTEIYKQCQKLMEACNLLEMINLNKPVMEDPIMKIQCIELMEQVLSTMYTMYLFGSQCTPVVLSEVDLLWIGFCTLYAICYREATCYKTVPMQANFEVKLRSAAARCLRYCDDKYIRFDEQFGRTCCSSSGLLDLSQVSPQIVEGVMYGDLLQVEQWIRQFTPHFSDYFESVMNQVADKEYRFHCLFPAIRATLCALQIESTIESLQYIKQMYEKLVIGNMFATDATSSSTNLKSIVESHYFGVEISREEQQITFVTKTASDNKEQNQQQQQQQQNNQLAKEVIEQKVEQMRDTQRKEFMETEEEKKEKIKKKKKEDLAVLKQFRECHFDKWLLLKLEDEKKKKHTGFVLQFATSAVYHILYWVDFFCQKHLVVNDYDLSKDAFLASTVQYHQQWVITENVFSRWVQNVRHVLLQSVEYDMPPVQRRLAQTLMYSLTLPLASREMYMQNMDSATEEARRERIGPFKQLMRMFNVDVSGQFTQLLTLEPAVFLKDSEESEETKELKEIVGEEVMKRGRDAWNLMFFDRKFVTFNSYRFLDLHLFFFNNLPRTPKSFFELTANKNDRLPHLLHAHGYVYVQVPMRDNMLQLNTHWKKKQNRKDALFGANAETDASFVLLKCNTFLEALTVWCAYVLFLYSGKTETFQDLKVILQGVITKPQ